MCMCHEHDLSKFNTLTVNQSRTQIEHPVTPRPPLATDHERSLLGDLALCRGRRRRRRRLVEGQRASLALAAAAARRSEAVLLGAAARRQRRRRADGRGDDRALVVQIVRHRWCERARTDVTAVT